MSKDVIPGPILAVVTAVYDGDTFTVNANVWPGVHMCRKVRCMGYDTPEIRARDPRERQLARDARDYLKTLIGERVQLTHIKDDKYGGRVDAEVLLMDGRPLSKTMIDAGHARAYEGGKRGAWV
jgi:endonuclease YncB( thermonuclease family)